MLRALAGGRRSVETLRIPSLASSPVRPGEMPARLVVHVALPTTWTAVPVGLQVVIAVEAAHVLSRVASRNTVEQCLDRLADVPLSRPAMIPVPRLTDYARQLAAARDDGPAYRGEIELLPPSRLLTAWRLAAGVERREIKEWIVGMLSQAPTRAVQWEAAAAFEGLTLTEWALLQALSA